MSTRKGPPQLEFNAIEPLQEYYYDGDGGHYSVAALVEASQDLPVFDCPLASLYLVGEIWNGCNMFELAYHVKRVMDADMSIPILIDWHGAIADGRHRVIRALAEGRTTIKARRITWKPKPCRTDPDES